MEIQAKLAKELGVEFKTETVAKKIRVNEKNLAVGVETEKKSGDFTSVIVILN